MEYFCCVLRRHLIKKFKDVGANALFNSFFGGQPIYFFWWAANLFLVGSQFIFHRTSQEK